MLALSERTVGLTGLARQLTEQISGHIDTDMSTHSATLPYLALHTQHFIHPCAIKNVNFKCHLVMVVVGVSQFRFSVNGPCYIYACHSLGSF